MKVEVEVIIETKCTIAVLLPEGISPPSFESGQFISSWLDKYMYPLIVPVGMETRVEQTVQSWAYTDSELDKMAVHFS